MAVLLFSQLSALLFEIIIANDVDRLRKKKKNKHKNLDVKLWSRMYLDIHKEIEFWSSSYQSTEKKWKNATKGVLLKGY